MKKFILKLYLFSFVFVSTARLQDNAFAATKKKGNSWTLPVVLMVLGLGTLWYGKRQNKKSKESQSSSSSSSYSSEAYEPAPFNYDNPTSRKNEVETGHNGNKGEPESAAGTTEKISAFATALNEKAKALTEKIIPNFENPAQGENELQDRKGEEDKTYENKKHLANNAHAYRALKEAGCDFDFENKDGTRIHSSIFWKEFFEAKKDKTWKAQTPGLSYEDFKKGLPSYKTGSVVVFDCNEDERTKYPVVSIIGEPEFRHGLENSHCPKIVAVYEPTGDKCQ